MRLLRNEINLYALPNSGAAVQEEIVRLALVGWDAENAPQVTNFCPECAVRAHGDIDWPALKAAAEKFVRRVEAGEVRSVRTVAEFRAALSGGGEYVCPNHKEGGTCGCCASEDDPKEDR